MKAWALNLTLKPGRTATLITLLKLKVFRQFLTSFVQIWTQKICIFGPGMVQPTMNDHSK